MALCVGLDTRRALNDFERIRVLIYIFLSSPHDVAGIQLDPSPAESSVGRFLGITSELVLHFLRVHITMYLALSIQGRLKVPCLPRKVW
jgi:hypothetical protein